MQDLQELVDHYVAQLSGPNAFSARHSLIEAGPPALSLVVDAFNTATDSHVKVSIVQIVSEYRTDSAVPFLVGLLADRRPDIWKGALDGLVILGNHAALDALREARLTIAREQRPWIDEAIQQIADGF
jgi:HEAT repeat protein